MKTQHTASPLPCAAPLAANPAPQNPSRRQTLLKLGGALTAVTLAGVGCGGSESPAPAPAPAPVAAPDTKAVAQWSAVLLQAVANVAAASPPGLAPMESSRLFASAYAAAHDALNGIDRRYKPYLSDLSAKGADPTAAVAAAMRDVLVALLPSQASYVDAQYALALNAVSAGAAKDAGVSVGQNAASAIVAVRTADGAANAQGPYPTPPGPGVYQPTIPTNFAAFVNWGAVAPFVTTSGSQFRPAGPLDVTSYAYTVDFNEVKALGGATSAARTADQSQIAKFWLENTPESWVRIAIQFSTAKALNGWDQARLFALLELAVADGYIGSLESKYHFRFWRPITAIRNADIDGNPDTAADLAWAPFDFVTPPVPDYPSAHATAGGAAEAVFKALYGDAFAFNYESTSTPGITRNFTHFSRVAEEIALSRVYVGYHFRHAILDGRAQGIATGEFVVQNALLRA